MRGTAHWRATGGEGETPREGEAHEGRGPLSGLNNPMEDADACRDRSPGVEPIFRITSPRRLPGVKARYPVVLSTRELEWMVRLNGEPQEGKGPREGSPALQVEIDPEGQNPTGGTGMKQGRQVTGGAKPRERAKR
jgi:hypothetical protein